jgi:hypothetical protein
MSAFKLLQGVRDLEVRLDDYRPKKWRGNQFMSDSNQRHPDNEAATSICRESIGYHVEGNNTERSMNSFHTPPFPPPMKSASFNLRPHHNGLGHSRLDEIAKAIRTLTYGEMLELAESMWKVNSHGSEITEYNLPGVLHRWSTSRR